MQKYLQKDIIRWSNLILYVLGYNSSPHYNRSIGWPQTVSSHRIKQKSLNQEFLLLNEALSVL